MTTSHILIVDDEPRVAFFLCKALEHTEQDYRISVAHSGEEALEILDRSSVDLLVTDLRMPGISGLELMRWVRASSPQTRTILITAYGDDEVETEAHRLEAYNYITKPFNVDDFTKAVQEALRDVAISQPGLVILSDESFEAITQQLEDLRREVGAQCIFLADMLGQRLAEVGVSKGVDSASLLSLLAGGFATTGELARHIGSEQSVNLNYHEGTRYEIYSATVGDNLFLAMLYDRKGRSSRVGLVWLYTRRAIERLLAALSRAEAVELAQPLAADFGTSLMTELDSLFPGSPAPGEDMAMEGPIASPQPRSEDVRSAQTAPTQPPPPVPSEPAPAKGAIEWPASSITEGAAASAPVASAARSVREPAPAPIEGPTLSRAGEPVPNKAEGIKTPSPESLSPVEESGETPSVDLGSEEELIDLETAIARGLIPPNLGVE